MEAFLLLKPDCLRAGLSAHVEREIEAEGLEIRCRHRIALTPADIRYLWNEYSDEGHSLMLGLLDRYLGGGPSQVVTLAGADAYEAARRVKRAIRWRFADGPFANVVHAAESPGELLRQGKLLLGWCERCSGARPASTFPDKELRPTGMLFENTDPVLDALWARLRAGLPRPEPVQLGGAGSVVVLGVDTAHSLDSTVTAVYRALPGVDLGAAIELALHANRVGRYPIGIGTPEETVRSLELLRANGIANCWTENC
ncbi:hypothetical protein AB0M43_24690 [Longispora sp. NPDC051575]|uniref:hypothetical protein n=1 Tax=Longispora sp. NPDC051575 TaxID=3154943 RepID=UPI0034474B40